MKFSSVFLGCSLLASSSNAFVLPQRKNSVSRTFRMSADDEVARLRAAAAKAREDADRLAKELGRSSPTETATPKKQNKKKPSLDELTSLLSDTDCGDSTQLEALREDGALTQWKSANLRTYPVSLNMLESRTGLEGAKLLGASMEEVDLEDFKYATLGVTLGSGALGVASLAFLPENVGPTLCYLFAVIPILFLGVGSSAPQLIANAVAFVKKGGDSESTEGDESDRVCRHEAAHFCCGYLCGLPIQDYSVGADGYPRVEFAAPTSSFTSTQVSQLVVAALGGLVGESMKYGGTRSSATNDLLELETTVFRRSDDFIGAAAQQDLTRWGALTAFTLLAANKEKYEKVVEAFAEKRSIAECIAILEA